VEAIDPRPFIIFGVVALLVGALAAGAGAMTMFVRAAKPTRQRSWALFFGIFGLLLIGVVSRQAGTSLELRVALALLSVAIAGFVV